jgi:hypothetical protein
LFTGGFPTLETLKTKGMNGMINPIGRSGAKGFHWSLSRVISSDYLIVMLIILIVLGCKFLAYVALILA